MFRLHGFAALVASLVIQTSAVTLRVHDVASPVQKVVTLLGQLEMKIIKDGEEEQKAFEAFMEWCSTGEVEKAFEIKTSKANIEDLAATIGKAESDVATLSSKIEDLAGAISTNEADLKAASTIRTKEKKEFDATETEMRDTIDTLERAINVLQRKMHSSAMLQAKLDTTDINKLIKVMSTMIDAAALSLHDKQKLLGLVQNTEAEQDDEMDTDLGAPAAKVYEGKSEGIVDVLEDLKQKAVTQLEQARREEMNAKHNFDLLRQSLEDQISVDSKDLSDSKNLMHEATETKATAQGELEVTKKVLTDAQTVLKNMKGDCTQKAADHEASVKNRADELKALAAAKKALQQMTAGAAEVTYEGSASFLQIDRKNIDSVNSNIRTGVDLANFEVVNLVRKLAKEERSAALEQLASRISAAIRDGATLGEDPFVKVKNLISNMIERLQKEAGEEAQHKAYCDKEMAGTKQKLAELKYDLEKYGSKIDKAKSDSATLKDEVVTLRQEIAEIVKSQGKADQLRKSEHKIYVQSKTDLEQGLQGVRMALKVLRDYYNSEGEAAAASAASLAQQPEDPEFHSKSTGGATGIIGMLEVVESDFGKTLAATEMNEEAAATAYEKMGMENRMSKTMKEKDVEYKTKEAANLDKEVSELTSDQESAQTELDAVLKYSANIRGMCELKPESYTDRKARREAEVAGLKEALQILEGESVLLQRARKHPKGLLIRA